MSENRGAVTQQDPIIKMLSKYRNTIASVLPKHITPERMLRIASTVIFRNPKLRECTPLSLVNGVIEISMLGLDIGRTAHLIPFKSHATVIIDYKGFIELAHRSGQINSFPFKPVYANDQFDYEEGTERYIRHKPAAHDRGELIAAYAICNFKHGGFDFEVVHPVDISATKRRAPGANKPDSPWNQPDLEWTMWCKTAVRRLAKRIPQSPELQKAIELEDLVEAGLKQNLDHLTEDIIDIDAIPPKEEPPATDPKDAINQRLKDLKDRGQTEREYQTTIEPEIEPGPATLHGESETIFETLKRMRPSTSDANMKIWKEMVARYAVEIALMPLDEAKYIAQKWAKACPGEPFPSAQQENPVKESMEELDLDPNAELEAEYEEWKLAWAKTLELSNELTDPDYDKICEKFHVRKLNDLPEEEWASATKAIKDALSQ